MPIFYTGQYPIHDADHVKATSTYDNPVFEPYFATNPALSKTGSADVSVTWHSVNGTNDNQRFHIDLGSAKIIRRIYIENHHHNGGGTNGGIKNFIFWGSNNVAAFAELTYGIDTNWTELTVTTNVFLEHVASDEVDPQYILVINSISYQYYAFKISDNYTRESTMAIRHIELQTEDGYTPPVLEKEASRTGIYTFKTLKI